MPLEKQFLPIVPKGVDQRTDPELLPPGKLTELRNVQQPTPGLYQKRNGYTSMDLVADSGTVPNGRGLASNGDAVVLRSNEGIYVRSESMGKWMRKATCRPVAVPPSPEVMPYGYKPSMCLSADGKYRYYFCGDIGQNVIAEHNGDEVGAGQTLYNRKTYWYYRIVDAATGAEVVKTTAIATGSGWMSKPVVAGGYVWLFIGAHYTATNYLIYVAKFDPASPETAPTVSTYYDGGNAGTTFVSGFDVRLTPSGVAIVAIAGQALAKTGGGTSPGIISFLDPTTSLPQASPGNVGIAITATPPASGLSTVSWLEDAADPSPAAYYFVITGGGYAKPVAYTINLTTLALTSTATLAGFASAPELLTGYLNAGNFITFSSDPFTGTTGKPENDEIECRTHDTSGVSGGQSWTRRAITVLSHPFHLSGSTTWYILAQHDDSLEHAQGAYYLLQGSDGKIVGRVLYGQGGDACQRATFVQGTENGYWVTRAITDTENVNAAVNGWSSSIYVSREVTFTIDATDADRLGPLVAIAPEQEVAIPGAWPLHVAGENVVEYITMYPKNAPVVAEIVPGYAGGLPLGTYTCYYLYAFRDSAGNIHRSRSSPPGNVTIVSANATIQWSIDSFRATNSAAGEWFLELYATQADDTTPYFQVTVPNDPTTGTVVFTIYQTSIFTNETLYTYNGAELPNDPPPPFRTAFVWRDRMFLLDTDVQGDVWVSKEKTTGFGFAFSGTLAFNLAEAGRIRAGGGVDFNYAALFSDAGIWVISGDGPDSARGNGQYQPTRLPGTLGCTNPHSVVTTPQGLVFQATDGRAWLLTRSLQLVDLGAGVESYKDQMVKAAVFDARAQHVRMHAEAE
jgi:hypothetical protein